MAREYIIPSTSTIIQDFGLNVTPPVTQRNKRVVILGTSEDGPMYEPIKVDKPEDAEIVWGRNGRGSLTKGIFECWNTQEGNPDVVGVRIGNGKTAVLDILERTGATVDKEQPTATYVALGLKAKFPGSVYNQITIKYDDRRNIAIYNPKTGYTSTFSVDYTNPHNSSVQAHNAKELVDAINADRNLSSVLVATVSGVVADYEVKLLSSTDGVTTDTTGVTLDLKALLTNISNTTCPIVGRNTTSDTAYIVPIPTLPYASGSINNLTVTNNLVALDTIESVSYSEWEKVSPVGSIAQLIYNPLDGKGESRWNTIQTLYDYDSDSKFALDPSGVSVKSEYIEQLNFVLTDEAPTDEKGKDGDNIFTLSTYLPLDDSEEPHGSGVALDWIYRNKTAKGYENYRDISVTSKHEAYTYGTCQYIEPKVINGNNVRPSGTIRVYVSNTLDPNGNWTEVPYDIESGVYMQYYDDSNDRAVFGIGANARLAYSGGYETIYLTKRGGAGNAGVKFTNMTSLVDISGYILADRYIRVTANSIKGFFSEAESLPQLEAVGSDVFSTYFVRGQEVVFNRAPAYPMAINYGTRITYEVDTNVTITDPVTGEIRFTDPDLLPGPGGGSLSSTKYSFLRLKYSYLPNFPAVTTLTQNLNGGTDGNKLTVKQTEDELKKAYDYLKDFPARFWVPMEGYIDGIKEEFNRSTGLKERQGTSVAVDIEDFLENQSINSVQPHAILGVTPLKGTSLGDRDSMITNLTQVDYNNATRGANAMAAIQNKFISVVAFEPVFPNIGRGQPYTSNGQAAYAGMLASLPYDISPTNKMIPGISAMRYDLSIRQHESMNLMRYVTVRIKPDGKAVIVNDVTAAPYGSDFVSWTTYSIVAEASDRVKSVADSYLGRPNSSEVRNAMDQDISNVLMNMSGLQAYNFSISSTIEQQVLGVVEIDLILVPIFTMKKIRTTVKVRKNLPTNA